jgi:WD40 repeat protein
MDYGIVKVWGLDGGRPRALPAGGGAEVLDFAFTQDASRILDVSDDGVVRVRALSGGRPRVVRGDLGEPIHAALSSDQQRVATADDRLVRVWPVAGGPPVLSRRMRDVSDVAFSADGRRIAAAAFEGGTVKAWRVDGRPAGTWRIPEDLILDLAFAPDGSTIAVAAGLGVYLLTEGQSVPLLLGRHDRAVEDVEFSPSGEEIASGGADGKLKIWNVDDGTALTLPDVESVDTVAYNSDGTQLATIGNDSRLHLWRCLACGPIDRPLTIARRLLPRHPIEFE